MLDTTPTPDFAAIKAKQNAAWSSGDYAKVGTTLQIVGETLCETANLRPGARVLDVAAGNGNFTLAAARRFAEVTSTDYVPALLEASRRRAEAEGHDIAYQVADAEFLPFDDGSFDLVGSTFGVMFVADHQRAADELMRVCRKGGTVAMANWTPEGFIGQLFKVVGGHVPPAPGMQSPVRWGTEAALREMFGARADAIILRPRAFPFRYKSTDHFMEVFRTWYGPVLKAFEAAGDKAGALDEDIRALIAEHNVSGDGTVLIQSGYVDVLIHKG